MTIPTIFETCRPRADVLEGSVAEADFAADLAQVIVGSGNEEYLDPARFFDNIYPTRGLRNLLANVCRRLTGAGGEVAAIFRLDTSYGGGKTHGLIALTDVPPSNRSMLNERIFGTGPAGPAPDPDPGPMRLFWLPGPQGPGTMMRTLQGSCSPTHCADGAHYSPFAKLRSSPGRPPGRGTRWRRGTPAGSGC